MTPVAALAPKWTAVVPVRSVPVSVTVLPPAAAPWVGLSAVTVGAGRSSLTIVPTPWASVIVALPVAFERFTLNVSFGSTVVSPLTCTVTVCEVTPGAKVTVPEFAV